MITSKNLRFFRKAKSMTELSDFNRIHLGCVMVYKNKVISVGHNTYKTHPVQKKFQDDVDFDRNGNVSHLHAKHAEIDCLVSVKREDIDWSKVEVYIYRARKIKPYGMARPCKACMKALQNKGIRHIYYTTDYGLAYEDISSVSLEDNLFPENT